MDTLYKSRIQIPETRTTFRVTNTAVSSSSLASFVGQMPATLNMLWWNTFATATDFTASFWTTQNVSVATGVISLDNTTNASSLVENVAGGAQVHTLSAGGIGNPSCREMQFITWRVAVIGRANARDRIVVQWEEPFGNGNQIISVGFNLKTGQTGYDSVVGSDCTLVANSITSLGSGWYLCIFDFTLNVAPLSVISPVWLPKIFLDNGTGTAARSTNYIGTGATAVDLWWFSILPAIGWNINNLNFYDDFVDLSGIDLSNTKAPGFKWYIGNWPDAASPNPILSNPPMPAGVATISSPSILKIWNPNPNATSYTSQITTATGIGSNAYVGNVWNGPVVFDSYLNYDNSVAATFYALGNTNAPAFWGESVEFRTNNGLDANQDYLEIDTTEAFPQNNTSSSVHSLQLLPVFNDLDHLTITGMYNPATLGTFVRVSSMWITMASNGGNAGIFLYFINGQFHNDAVKLYTASLPAGSAYSITDGHHLPLILITAENTSPNPGGGWPLYVDWVKVYTT